MSQKVERDTLGNHLERYPNEKQVINKFMDLFNIGVDARKVKLGYELSIFFLKPLKHAREAFSFEKDLVLIYSPQKIINNKVLESIERFVNQFKGTMNVETLCYILVSNDNSVREKVVEYVNTCSEAKIIIPFSYEELKKSADWFVRNRFSEHLFVRDLFDVKQPLKSSTFYFGRKNVVRSLVEKLGEGENIGLFGLRKTGKTSTLYQVQKMFETDKSGICIRIDAQNPAIYSKNWWDLLSLIKDEIINKIRIELPSKINKNYNSKNASEYFCTTVKRILESTRESAKKILIIIDEIEHISPYLSLNKEWNQGFIPFWQTLRSLQSSQTRVSFLIAGVNAKPVEMPSVGGIDNPLFSLINPYYIPGFDRNEVRDMVRTLGRYMGMHFSEDTYEYLREHYGGHPLLIRLSCSYLHKKAIECGLKRPITIDLQKLRDTEEQRDLNMYYYGLHILEVLKQFYKEEYEMLELLASGFYEDFIELSKSAPEFREHLIKYGLITDNNFPQITISCIKKFLYNDYTRNKKVKIVNEYEHKEITKGLEKIKIEYTDKIIRIKSRIITKISNHNKTYPSKWKKPIWTISSRDVEVSSDLKEIELCKKSADFNALTSYLKQLLWENVDRSEIEKNYKELFNVCVLLNGFRNYYQHLELSEAAAKNAEKAFEEYCDGGYPLSESDWIKLHIKLIENIADALNITLSYVSSS